MTGLSCRYLQDRPVMFGELIFPLWHFFLEQGRCLLCIAFDWPPTAAKKEKGVFRGHPEPRQRASPSALPMSVKEGEDARPRTPAKGFVPGPQTLYPLHSLIYEWRSVI